VWRAIAQHKRALVDYLDNFPVNHLDVDNRVPISWRHPELARNYVKLNTSFRQHGAYLYRLLRRKR